MYEQTEQKICDNADRIKLKRGFEVNSVFPESYLINY